MFLGIGLIIVGAMVIYFARKPYWNASGTVSQLGWLTIGVIGTVTLLGGIGTIVQNSS